jgi:ATP-dependent 26S proteasome regulatory subunit
MPSLSQTQKRGVQVPESHLHDLEAIIRSRTPLVAIESDEEPEVLAMMCQISNRLQIRGFRWTVTEGLQSFDPANQPAKAIENALDALAYIKTNASNALFALLDFHPVLQESVHVRLLKDIALAYPQNRNTVVLVSHELKLPVELRPFAGFFRLPLPTMDELRGIVYEVASDWATENGRSGVETTNKALELLVRNLAGLTATDARRLARKAISDNGVISQSTLPSVMRAKYELLGQDGVLSFENDTVSFAEIGGMRRMRTWLEQRQCFFLEEPDGKLDAPRGLLLLGVQGCGKSLAAKAAAGIFSIPLLRLDFGVLYNKYYGETERNLRRALETAELLAPCVLWMDELEKGVATGDEDDGLSRRILGTLLTWMSERRSAVFVVATANAISRLPPELVRKGRFDEIFFVDLPSAETRRQILDIHLQKRGLNPANFDLASLAETSDGFSGSELEQAIVSASYAARAQSHGLAQDRLLEEIRLTKPLSVVMAEQVNELRQWATGRTVPCD